MKSVPHPWNIYILAQRKNRINPRPQYQRAPVWSLGKKQKLIDSILRGYDIPKFYLRSSSDPAYEHEVVDGQQRIRAIWEFLEGGFPLAEDCKNVPGFGDLSGKLHEDLPSDAADRIGLFGLSIVVIEEASELEIRDLFLRLQDGVSLNAAERRNAMPGEMRDFVAEMAMHKVFQGVRMRPNVEERYGRDDWIAHVVCLEVNGGPVDIKAPDLKKMYEDHKSLASTKSRKVSAKVKRTLNYMANVFEIETPEMDIKWGFVDMYWLLSVLLDEYDMAGRETDINTFYITFEQRRRNTDDIQNLISSGDHLDKLLFEYMGAFQRSGAARKNVEIRHSVYRQWLHTLVPDLAPKDRNRSFTRDERVVIWRLAEMQCAICGTEVTLKTMHADHIEPHSKGGLTILSNAQCLCAQCNKRKGAV